MGLERDHAWNDYQVCSKKFINIEKLNKEFKNKLKNFDIIKKNCEQYSSQLSQNESEIQLLSNRIQESVNTIQTITKQRNILNEKCSILETTMLQYQQQTDILFKEACKMVINAWKPILNKFKEKKISFEDRLQKM